LSATSNATASPPSITPRPRRPLSSRPPDRHTRTAVAKFHDERDIPGDVARIWAVRASLRKQGVCVSCGTARIRSRIGKR
jgi:hypothetical protein